MSAEDLNDVPRRLRRYYRRGESPPQEQESNAAPDEKAGERIRERQKTVEESLKERNSRIAEQELRKFREKFKRLPKENEFDEIADSIASQIKTETSRAGRERSVSEKARERQKIRSREAEGTPVQDLPREPESKASGKSEGKAESIQELLKGEGLSGGLGEEKEGELSIEGLSLDSEDLKKSLSGLEDEDSPENILKQVEKIDKPCPNCRSKAAHAIFCPNCGLAFCAHCARAIKDAGDKVSYVCPKCGTEFKAKKA